MGEVQSRTHTQGESEDHYESASRVFANPNRCHALTFYFYRINKCQRLRFTLVGIDRRVIDQAAPTEVTPRPPLATGGVVIRTNAVLATSKDRLEAERRARVSVAEREDNATKLFTGLTRVALSANAEPLAKDVRKAALEAVDKDLVAEGLLTAVGGEVSPKAQERLSWERNIVLPTPGLVVKGCLDDCDICEPTLMDEINLELELEEARERASEEADRSPRQVTGVPLLPRGSRRERGLIETGPRRLARPGSVEVGIGHGEGVGSRLAGQDLERPGEIGPHAENAHRWRGEWE